VHDGGLSAADVVALAVGGDVVRSGGSDHADNRFRLGTGVSRVIASATIQRLTSIAEVAGPHERFRLRAAAS
jgi:hypothetical protein